MDPEDEASSSVGGRSIAQALRQKARVFPQEKDPSEETSHLSRCHAHQSYRVVRSPPLEQEPKKIFHERERLQGLCKRGQHDAEAEGEAPFIGLRFSVVKARIVIIEP
jgi:hypothetical protein